MDKLESFIKSKKKPINFKPIPNGVPIVGQEIKQIYIATRSAGQHIEFQEYIVLGEISVLLQNGYVQETFNLGSLYRTTDQTFQQICSFALLSCGRKIDDTLQSKFPFFLGAPLEYRTNVLIGNAVGK